MFERLLRAAALLSSALLLVVPASAQKPQTAGVFIDRTGAEHPWSIAPTHALIWDGQPYIPVGGTFSPHYLAEGTTEENWQRDVQALERLKAKGALDILIHPIVSAVEIPAAAWQRLIDYLEEKGFRYGIGFGAGIRTPLTGTVVKPSSYRIAGFSEGVELAWEVPDADSARFLFVDATDGTQILREGQVRVQSGTALVPADVRLSDSAVALLYPRKTLAPTHEGALPDLWTGYDAYRDRLLTIFSQVKFGPGLRFFLDPLVHPLSLPGEAEYLIPDSPAFRLEWEAFLVRRYASPEDLMTAWGLVDRDIKEFRQAAAMIPLWAGANGVPFLLDTTTGKRYQVNAGMSRIWSDLRECRNDSLVYYMNAIADVLKREVANVPVVYTRTIHHRMFTNPNKSGGFDGIGIAAYARGSALVTGGADSVYSQAEESLKTIWCIVTETLDTAGEAKTQIGYASKQALFQDIDWLRGIGAKGFFINGFQVLPEATYRNHQLLNAPEQIDWLKEYADHLHSTLNLASSQPRVLPFPAAAAGLVRSGPIGNGSVWWVPSLASGTALEFGSSYAGYTISLPDGDRTVLWSLRGPRETHLYVTDPARVTITTPEGIPVKGRVDAKKKTLTLMLDSTPLLFQTGGQEIFPIEALEDSLKQLRALVSQALAAKLPAQPYKYQLDRAETRYKQREMAMAYLMVRQALDGLVEMVQPYTWREGEATKNHSFSEVALNEAASGGRYLLLNTSTRPPQAGYTAQYPFSVPADDIYTIWIACTPPGPKASPFVWLVDTGQAQESVSATVEGATYLADRFVWMRLGRIALKEGQHTFTLNVRDRAPGLERYYLAVDALLITRTPFTPNGTSRPLLAVDLQSSPFSARGKR